MYEKLKDNAVLKDLREGDILLHYPISGTPVDTLDLSDESYFALYELKKIYASTLVLQRIDESQILPENMLMTVVHKRGEDLVAEGVWWKRPVH